MILAEAVTFDPSVVVAFFLVLALGALGWFASLVLGVACGRRFGHDPSERRAGTVWSCCVAAQLLGAAGAVHITLASGWSPWLAPPLLGPLVVVGAMVTARRSSATVPSSDGPAR